jgi:hypothetical protein
MWQNSVTFFTLPTACPCILQHLCHLSYMAGIKYFASLSLFFLFVKPGVGRSCWAPLPISITLICRLLPFCHL